MPVAPKKIAPTARLISHGSLNCYPWSQDLSKVALPQFGNACHGNITGRAKIERVDDIPLLLAQMKKMEIASLLDADFPVHGNWQGLGLGDSTQNAGEKPLCVRVRERAGVFNPWRMAGHRPYVSLFTHTRKLRYFSGTAKAIAKKNQPNSRMYTQRWMDGLASLKSQGLRRGGLFFGALSSHRPHVFPFAEKIPTGEQSRC